MTLNPNILTPIGAASALAQKRWDKASAEEKSEHARRMLEARWGDHVAKRPASSRNTGKPRGRPKKKAAVKESGEEKARHPVRTIGERGNERREGDMTIEERVTAVERELEHQRELQRLREAGDALGKARLELMEGQVKAADRVLPRLEMALKELEEASIVTSGLQSRQGGVLKGHAEWLEELTASHLKTQEQYKRTQEQFRETDKRIEDLVRAIGELIRKK